MKKRLRRELSFKSLVPSGSAVVRVLSLDVLAALRAVPGQFPYSKKSSLVWANRRRLIREDLKRCGADIFLLQDVDRFEEFWQKILFDLGYDCYVGQRRDSSGIGAAICWRRSSFRPVRTDTIHLSECAPSVTAGSDRIRLERLSDLAVVASLMPRRYLGERPKTHNTGRVTSPTRSRRAPSPSRRPTPPPRRAGSRSGSRSGTASPTRATSPLSRTADIGSGISGGLPGSRPRSTDSSSTSSTSGGAPGPGQQFPVLPWGGEDGRATTPVDPELGHTGPLGEGGGDDGDGAGITPGYISLNEGYYPPRLRPLGSAIHLVSGTLLHAEPDGQNRALRRLRCLQAKYLCHKVGEFRSYFGASPLFMGLSAGTVPGSETHCALRLGRIPRGPLPPIPPVRPACRPLSCSSCLVAWPAHSHEAQGDRPVHAYRVLGRMVAEAPGDEDGERGGYQQDNTVSGALSSKHVSSSPSKGGGVWAQRLEVGAADAALTGRLRVQPVPVAAASDWREGPQLLAAIATGLPSGSSWQFRVQAVSEIGSSTLSSPSAAVVLPKDLQQAAVVGGESLRAGLTTETGRGVFQDAKASGGAVASGIEAAAVAGRVEDGADADVLAASVRTGDDAMMAGASTKSAAKPTISATGHEHEHGHGKQEAFEWAVRASGQRAADASSASQLVARKGGVAAERRVQVMPPPEWVLPLPLGKGALGASQDLAAQQGMPPTLAGSRGTAAFALTRPGEPLQDTIQEDAAGGDDYSSYREDGSLVPSGSLTGARPMAGAQRWHERALLGRGRDEAIGQPASVKRGAEEAKATVLSASHGGAGSSQGPLSGPTENEPRTAAAPPRPQEGAPVAGEGTEVGSAEAALALARGLHVHELGLRSAYEDPDGKGEGAPASGEVGAGSGLVPVPSLIPPSLPGHWTMWAPADTLGRDSADTLQLPLGANGYRPEDEHREVRRGVPGSQDDAFEVDYLMYSAASAVPVSVLMAPDRTSTISASSRPASPEKHTAAAAVVSGQEEEEASELDLALSGLFGGVAAGVLGIGGGEGLTQEEEFKRAVTPAQRRREGLPDADFPSHHVSLCADFAILPGASSTSAIK